MRAAATRMMTAFVTHEANRGYADSSTISFAETAMRIPQHIYKRITAKHGTVIDLKQRPEILQEIVDEIEAMALGGGTGGRGTEGGPPFGIPWMDSWVAHWTINEKILTAEARDREFSSILRALVDLKFNERLAEIKNFIRHHPQFALEPTDGDPPDGGPPEPGAPDPAPVRFEELRFDEPPDGGPPEPGVPPTGPEHAFLRDNPWIFYWFVSVKAPMVLEMIDAHLTRRMNDLKG
jgi:hypothetical protein